MHALSALLLDVDGHELALAHAESDDDRCALPLELKDNDARELIDTVAAATDEREGDAHAVGDSEARVVPLVLRDARSVAPRDCTGDADAHLDVDAVALGQVDDVSEGLSVRELDAHGDSVSVSLSDSDAEPLRLVVAHSVALTVAVDEALRGGETEAQTEAELDRICELGGVALGASDGMNVAVLDAAAAALARGLREEEREALVQGETLLETLLVAVSVDVGVGDDDGHRDSDAVEEVTADSERLLLAHGE